MDFQVNFEVNNTLYIKNPDDSTLGRKIVKTAIDLICAIGFEHFTFKKLAIEIHTTEASIYRYFENKHSLLLYILNWYWSYMEYLLTYKLQNVKNSKAKLELVVELLTHDIPTSGDKTNYNTKHMNQIVISESCKSYLVKDIDIINKKEVFKPYKDLCNLIANLIKEYSPEYKFAHSLSTTIIETSRSQLFFSEHLPRLTDIKTKNYQLYTKQYLHSLLFNNLK